MNEIHIPIEEVHLETVFDSGVREEYALLAPAGEVAPLRVLFSDLRDKLGDRFSPELAAEEVIDRLAYQDDIRLVVRISVDQHGGREWEVGVQYVTPYARPRGMEAGVERRSSPRMAPERNTDIKLEVGASSLEGMLYNVSEHGLGIALLTDQGTPPDAFRVDQVVELVGEARIRGRIASQYPAAGGCVLGIELKERFDYARLYEIDA